MLKPVQLYDLMQRLAEHTLEGHLHPDVVIAQLQKQIIEHALDLEGGNQVKTARRLGYHRNTLSRQIKVADLVVSGRYVKHGRRP